MLRIFRWFKMLFREPQIEYVKFDTYPKPGELFWKKDYDDVWRCYRCIDYETQDQSVIFHNRGGWSCCLVVKCYKKVKIKQKWAEIKTM